MNGCVCMIECGKDLFGLEAGRQIEQTDQTHTVNGWHRSGSVGLGLDVISKLLF